jgi:hypothetical protein
VDDLGYADVSCYGQRDYTTPNVDRLAIEGLRFTHGYSNSANCSPTRTGLITGRSRAGCTGRPSSFTVAQPLWEMTGGLLAMDIRGGDITDHYIRDSALGELQLAEQETISAHLVKALGNPRGLAWQR